MSGQSTLQDLCEAAIASIAEAKSSEELDRIETGYLGRKGEITQLLRRSARWRPKSGSPSARRSMMPRRNSSGVIAARRDALAGGEAETRLAGEAIDVTMPGRFWRIGRPHVLVETLRRIKEIFIGMGYDFVETPEIEDHKSNFEALNYPEEHPALDEQMSFYITDKALLRTHTTAYQHRVMSTRKPPMKVATMGKCYRSDAVDATHSHTFHQVDCFAIDRGISMADLKGTIHQFAVEMFGMDVNVRFRPDFFPFVEPGAEFSVTCIICGGDGL